MEGVTSSKIKKQRCPAAVKTPEPAPLEAQSLQEGKLIPAGIIREIFCGVYCTLVPLNVSFLFLLARRRGLCYASAKPNRLRNGEVCQSTQCKNVLKKELHTSLREERRSYGKTGLRIITLTARKIPPRSFCTSKQHTETACVLNCSLLKIT